MVGKGAFSKFTSSLFVLPYFILFSVFFLFPVSYGIWLSFRNYNFLKPDHKFIGLDNYIEVFTKDNMVHDGFFRGIWATTQFVIYSVPPLVILALLLALLLVNLPSKLRSFFRTIYFMPVAVSGTVMAAIWAFMYNSNSGLINLALEEYFGAEHISWINSYPWVWIALVNVTIWWTVGWNMIIFVNAINEIPEDLYEAASLDGANGWHKLKSITLPYIRPITLFISITTTLASFNVYIQPYLITNGGPGDSTKPIIWSITTMAFDKQEMGSASAMAVLLALLLVVITVLQYMVTNSRKGGIEG